MYNSNDLYQKFKGCRPSNKFIQFAQDLNKVTKSRMKDITYPCYGSEKFDGVYCIALKLAEDSVMIFSRTGMVYTSMRHIEKELNEIMKVAELVIFEAYNYDVDQPTISGWARDTKNQQNRLLGLMHDLLIIDEFVAGGGRSYGERFHELWTRVTSDSVTDVGNNIKYGTSLELIPHTVINNYLHAKAFAKGMIKLGAEGVILDNPKATYEGGKRTINKIKIKGKITYDLEVIGLLDGKGKHTGKVGAVICKFKDGITVKAGSGLTDTERADWKTDPSLIIGKIVEIEAMRDSTKGKVREGIFKGIRHDKTEGEF